MLPRWEQHPVQLHTYTPRLHEGNPATGLGFGPMGLQESSLTPHCSKCGPRATDPGKDQPCTSSGLLHRPQIPSQVLEAMLNPQKERKGVQRGWTVATLLPGLGTGGGGALPTRKH